MQQIRNIVKTMVNTDILFRFRIIVLLVTTPIIATVIYLYRAYMIDPLANQSPAALGLPLISIFCITIVVLAFTPWQELRILFTKHKPLEIKNMIETQVHERHTELSHIDERLTTLEEQIFDLDEGPFRSNPLNNTKLREIIILFLTTYKKEFYTSNRIKEWGAKQDGFEQLNGYELHQLNEVLRELVSNKILKIVVSKDGNTLYQLAN